MPEKGRQPRNSPRAMLSKVVSISPELVAARKGHNAGTCNRRTEFRVLIPYFFGCSYLFSRFWLGKRESSPCKTEGRSK